MLLQNTTPPAGRRLHLVSLDGVCLTLGLDKKCFADKMYTVSVFQKYFAKNAMIYVQYVQLQMMHHAGHALVQNQSDELDLGYSHCPDDFSNLPQCTDRYVPVSSGLSPEADLV